MKDSDYNILEAGNENLQVFSGHVRELAFHSLGAGKRKKMICSAFFENAAGESVGVYTDNSSLERALLAAYGASSGQHPSSDEVRICYITEGNDNLLTRVDLRHPASGKELSADFVSYNRAAALAYARARWSKVASDNYIGILSSPGYRTVPAGTIFVRTTPGDPRTEVARPPSGADIPLSELEDCAHFISCCIGEPPGGTGGGLPIGRDFPSAIYGRIASSRLLKDLKDKRLISIVGPERMPRATAVTKMNNNEIAEGDLIFYYFDNKVEPGHSALYLAGRGKRIACHTYCRGDQENDYDQSWEGVNGFTHCTLAKII